MLTGALRGATIDTRR